MISVVHEADCPSISIVSLHVGAGQIQGTSLFNATFETPVTYPVSNHEVIADVGPSVDHAMVPTQHSSVATGEA